MRSGPAVSVFGFAWGATAYRSNIWLAKETAMTFGDRFRAIRQEKHLSQGDIEKRCGLLRCYLSRVENGHIAPKLATLDKLASALEIPTYQFFCEDEETPVPLTITLPNPDPYPKTIKEVRWFRSLRKALSKINQRDRRLLLDLTNRIVSLKNKRHSIELRILKRSNVLRLPKASPARTSQPRAKAVGQ